MNDATLEELKIVVERTVRPLHAPVSRKRRMRQELLAHLTAVFEEEAARLGDPQAALDRAEERFGDPRELAVQLQATVSWREKVDAFSERFLLYRPGEPVLAHAARAAAPIFVMFSSSLLLVVPVLLLRGRAYEIPRVALALLVGGLFIAAFLFAAVVLGHGLREALFREGSPPRVARAIVLCLLSAAVVPAFGFLLNWIAAGDVVWAWSLFRWHSCLAPLVPLVMLAGARQIARDFRDDEPWARLKIG